MIPFGRAWSGGFLPFFSNKCTDLFVIFAKIKVDVLEKYTFQPFKKRHSPFELEEFLLEIRTVRIEADNNKGSIKVNHKGKLGRGSF